MIKKVFTGSHTSFVIDQNNFLYGTGSNSVGQLGLGATTRQCLNFTLIPTLPRDKHIISIVAGSNFSYVLLEDGTLWVAGGNNRGSVGIGSTQDIYPTFTLVTTLPRDKKITMMAAGFSHILILVADGTLWGTGYNANGQLGLGHNQTVHQFTPITTLPADKAIVSIATGSNSSFVLLEDNSVWATGANEDNQLGFNNTATYYHFTQLTTLPDNQRVVSIAAGSFHTHFLMADGNLWGVGNGRKGILGIMPSENNQLEGVNLFKLSQVTVLPPHQPILKVVASMENSFILLQEGTLWGMGSNFYRQLGFGHNQSAPTFTLLSGLPADKSVMDVASGNGSVLASLEDGSVWVAGNNGFGQLGMGDTMERAVFTPCASLREELFHANPRKVESLESLALAKYRERPDINPYLPDSYQRIVSQTTPIIASELFMPHLYGCSDCERYVKPTVWNRCPYPHRLLSSPAASTSAAASGSTDTTLAKSDEAGPAESHSHKR